MGLEYYFLKYVITDAWNCGSAHDPFGVEGRWLCRILAVHVSSPPLTATSVRTLAHVALCVPQVRAVPNVKRKVFGTLRCHRDDTGASGRRVSFKLPGWLSSSRVGPCKSRFRQNAAREGIGRCRAVEGKVPDTASTVLVYIPTASWECWDHGVVSHADNSHKGDQPQNWRATDPSTSGHQPHNWAGRRLFFNLVGVLESWEFLRLQRVGGHCTMLNGKASELSGLPSTMSWPRSVREARLHCVRGRIVFFLLFAFRSASLAVGSSVLCLPLTLSHSGVTPGDY